MNEYLYRDVYSIKSDLEDMLNNSNNILSNTTSMMQSLNRFESLMNKGFSGVQSQLIDISYQLEDILDVMIDFRNMTFIQNEERNQLLASIDATLKAPNKTAAHEKYEIALELADKNKPDTAIQFLKKAIELNPLHFRVYIQLTLNLLKTKNYKEAFHYAKESINFAPNNNEILAYTYSLAARASEKLKNFQGALNYINQAAKLNNQSSYIYEKARYLVKLDDISESMKELKKAIEMNSEYFAISLVDSVFLPCRNEQEQLLMSLKEELESKLNYAISQMETIQLHNYNFDNERDTTERFRYPEFPSYEVEKAGVVPKQMDVTIVCYWDKNGKEESIKKYCYREVFWFFDFYYNQLSKLHHNKLPLVKELKKQNTYISYRKSEIEFLSYKEEYNYLIINFKRFLKNTKEAATLAKEVFIENLESVKENRNKLDDLLFKDSMKRLIPFYSWFSKTGSNDEWNDKEKASKLLRAFVQNSEYVIRQEEKHTAAINNLLKKVNERPLPDTIK